MCSAKNPLKGRFLFIIRKFNDICIEKIIQQYKMLCSLKLYAILVT